MHSCSSETTFTNIISTEFFIMIQLWTLINLPPVSFTEEVNSRLTKRPVVFNWHLTNHGLISLIKGVTGVNWKIDVENCSKLTELRLKYSLTHWVTHIIFAYNFPIKYYICIYISIQENAFETVVWKCRPSCLGINVLKLNRGTIVRYQATTKLRKSAYSIWDMPYRHLERNIS